MEFPRKLPLRLFTRSYIPSNVAVVEDFCTTVQAHFTGAVFQYFNSTAVDVDNTGLRLQLIQLLSDDHLFTSSRCDFADASSSDTSVACHTIQAIDRLSIDLQDTGDAADRTNIFSMVNTEAAAQAAHGTDITRESDIGAASHSADRTDIHCRVHTHATGDTRDLQVANVANTLLTGFIFQYKVLA